MKGRTERTFATCICFCRGLSDLAHMLHAAVLEPPTLQIITAWSPSSPPLVPITLHENCHLPPAKPLAEPPARAGFARGGGVGAKFHPAKFHPDQIRGFVSAHARFRASNCLLGYSFFWFFKSSTAKTPARILTQNTTKKDAVPRL